MRPPCPSPCTLCGGVRNWLHRAGPDGLWMCPICDWCTPPDEYARILERRLQGDRDA